MRQYAPGKTRRVRRGRRRACASPRPLHGDWPPCSTPQRARDYERRLDQVEIEIDNLRAAFAWSRENGDIELALRLASSLQPLWLARGRVREGLALFDAALTDLDAQHAGVAVAVRARALADKAVARHAGWAPPTSLDQAQQALAIAREVDDPALLGRALTACGFTAAAQKAEVAGRTSPRRSAWPARSATGGGSARSSPGRHAGRSLWGDPIAARAAGQEGRDLAEAIGDRFDSRVSAAGASEWHSYSRAIWPEPLAQFDEVVAEAGAAHDGIYEAYGLASRASCWRGRVTGGCGPGRGRARPSRPPPQLGRVGRGQRLLGVGCRGSWPPAIRCALHETEATWQHLSIVPGWRRWAARVSMRRPPWPAGTWSRPAGWADDAVASTTGYYQSAALLTRASVAIAQGEAGTSRTRRL